MSDEVKRDTSGPAFPYVVPDVEGRVAYEAPGMTLRDYFAAKALPKCLEEFWGQADDFSVDGAHTYAEAAYQIADAMLIERAKAAKP